jgi:phosphomannomutase
LRIDTWDGLARAVVASKARLGVAFDDGDRALFVDHEGTVDGDAIL